MPIVIAVAKVVGLLAAGSWSNQMLIALAYAPALWLMMTLFSYGVDTPIHNFWEWIFGGGQSGNNRVVEMFTRGTCGAFWSLAALAFAFVTGYWAAMVGYVLFLTFANAYIGGTVKDVEISERLVGMSVALALLV
jgi:hypothetical protein